MNSLTAHHEWATRPSDERYTSVQALYQAAAERHVTTEEFVMDLSKCETQATTDNALVLCEPDRGHAPLTHWSFGQLAAIAGAPAQYLRTLPAYLASDNINYGLRRERRRADQQVLADRTSPGTIHAITSPVYERVHNDDLFGRVVQQMAEHPEWRLPLGYKDGAIGAEKVPSGAYLGDRDAFLFLVDGNRDLDDPTDGTHSGLFRGFILRNSDVGAAKLTLDLFLFRVVCGNHIIHGLRHVATFRRRHIGTQLHSEWPKALGNLQKALDADTSLERSVLTRASTTELGATRDEVVDLTVRRFKLTRKQAQAAFGLAEQFEQNPRSIWGYVQGLTILSQQTPWQDARFTLDVAAGRLLSDLN